MAGTVINVTDADFEAKVVKGAGPVLAVFRAEWSDVCRALDPVPADVAKEYSGRLTVARLDIDESPKTTEKNGVNQIPTLHVFKGGQDRRHLDRARQQGEGRRTDHSAPVTCGTWPNI